MDVWLVENDFGSYPCTSLKIGEQAVVVFDFERSRVYAGNIEVKDDKITVTDGELTTTFRPITMSELIRNWNKYFMSDRPKTEQEAEQLLRQSLDNAYYL